MIPRNYEDSFDTSDDLFYREEESILISTNQIINDPYGGVNILSPPMIVSEPEIVEPQIASEENTYDVIEPKIEIVKPPIVVIEPEIVKPQIASEENTYDVIEPKIEIVKPPIVVIEPEIVKPPIVVIEPEIVKPQIASEENTLIESIIDFIVSPKILEPQIASEENTYDVIEPQIEVSEPKIVSPQIIDTKAAIPLVQDDEKIDPQKQIASEENTTIIEDILEVGEALFTSITPKEKLAEAQDKVEQIKEDFTQFFDKLKNDPEPVENETPIGKYALYAVGALIAFKVIS